MIDLERLSRYSRSLVVRLVALAIVVVGLGFLGRILILLPFLKDNLTILSAAYQLSIAEYVARDIDGKIGERLDLIGFLAAKLPPALLADPAGAEAWLRERHETNPLFSTGLILIPPDGKGAIVDYPVVEGRRRLDYGGSDYFRAAFDQRRVVLGKPLHGRASGVPVVIVAAPVLAEDGTVIAVLAGVTAHTAPGFLDLIQETRVGISGGFLLISPRDNLFVAATDSAMTLAPLPPPGKNPLHDRAMAGYRGTGITVNIAGIEELSAMVSVPRADWFLVARLPTTEAFQAVEHTRHFVTQNAILAGSGTVLVLSFLLYRFFRPLTLAARLIHRMAKGDVELQPVPVVRRDEVGELAEGFNFLLARLDSITAEKLAGERQRVVEKERMERSLRQWMADTSHELRTPIAVLRAQVEAIQDGVHAADAGTLGVLHREVMGMSQLVDDLYTLARSDVGQLDCRFDPVAPLGLIDDAMVAFRDRYAAAGLTVVWACDANAGPVIRGDAARLRQVFGNLMENTLRYTDAGGGLRIGWEIAGGSLLFHFDDSPPGVPVEALPHLFERFYRVDGSRSRERGGAGIGLAVCLSVIEAHGGWIRADPSTLGGLRITIALPRMADGHDGDRGKMEAEA